MSQVPPAAPTGQPQTPTPAQPKGGMSTTKVVLLVLAIIFGVSILACGGLAAILIPSLNSARNEARRTMMMSNLRQVAVAIHAYAADYDGCLPRHVGQLEQTYMGDADDLFVSPFNPGGSVGRWIDEGGSEALYRYGDYLFAHAYEQDADAMTEAVPTSSISSPSGFIVAFSAKTRPGREGRAVLFADGHCEWLEEVEFREAVAHQNAARRQVNLPEIDLLEVAAVEAGMP